MAVLTEGAHAGEFLFSESNLDRSRDNGVLATGQVVKAGAILGVVGVATSAVAAAVAGNTGNGAMGTVTVGAGAKAGVYRLTIVEPAANAGAFVVEDPDGITVGNGDVAAAFTGGGLAFTLADGATDFAAGDQFTITVAAGSLKYKEYNPANTDGSDRVAGIAWANYDATAADVKIAVITRDAEVKKAELKFFTGANAGQKTQVYTELAQRGIIARESL